MYDAKEESSKSIHVYSRAIDFAPESVVIASLLGTAYFRKQMYDKAVKWLERSVKKAQEFNGANHPKVCGGLPACVACCFEGKVLTAAWIWWRCCSAGWALH